MWKIDLDAIEKVMQPTFERLYEKKEVIEKRRPLTTAALLKIKDTLSVEWTYNSNSIEGNTLNLRETHMVLKEGITIRGKSLREHFEVHNHEKAINFLYTLINKEYVLRSTDILSLHHLVMRSIEDDYAGRLRNGGVRISGANFIPPSATKVSDLIDELVEFVNTNPLGLSDILLATVFHHKFVWIHPFFDGNGRTVRLAMNLLLMKQGFPPAIILKNDRNKYYEALNNANQGNYVKLALLMSQSIERSLNIYLDVVSESGAGYVDISSIVNDPSIPYGQEYISLLARQGKIDAYKEGRNWLTTKAAVEAYMKNRKRERKLDLKK